MNCALSVVGCRLIARRLPRVTDSCVTAKAPSSAFGTFCSEDWVGGGNQPRFDALEGPPLSLSVAPSHREPFSPSVFQLGEKVPKADEGEVLARSEALTVCANYARAKRPPHPPIGTFSPRKKPRGEKGSRLESIEPWKEGSRAIFVHGGRSKTGWASPAEKRGGEGLSMGRWREGDTNSRLLTTRPRRRQPTTDNRQRAAQPTTDNARSAA